MKETASGHVRSLLQGAYDLHTHTIPSQFPRALDDFELVRQATDLGMAGVMIKSHYEPTGARAALVNRNAPAGSARAYGGVALNWPVGGLNLYAVESALRMGASIVWMPTRDAENCLLCGDMPGDFFSRPGISILDEAGRLVPAVYEIIETVKKYDACLATGHLSTAESIALCREGRSRGARMILTHPEWERTVVPRAIQTELADIGVIVEKNWLNIAEGSCTAQAMLENIRAVGTHRVYLATDRGQRGAETPAQGMQRFVALLLENGFTDAEITDMAVRVPKELVLR